MSQVHVHNFTISLDGFGTGEGLTLEAPFGHAGERLHAWMFATRFWHNMVGKPGGGTGIDHVFAARHEVNIGAEIMGRGKFGPPRGGPWTGVGTEAEWRGWWGPNPPFHTPVIVLTHHPRPAIEMEGGTTFHFVDATPMKRWSWPGSWLATATCASAAARRRCGIFWPLISSMSATSCRRRSCSGGGYASGTAWKGWRSATPSRPSPPPAASRT